jgi:hypothetical protein
MANKGFTVFLCSTYEDLSEERDGVLDAIKRLQLQHDAMEFFGARSNLPIETCLAEVRRSDVIVVIVGHRYGSLVPEIGISFSEAEYREAQRLGKPCLVYVRDENVPVLPRFVERDPEKLKLLQNWKDTLSSRHTISFFSNSHQLAVQVTADLSRTIQALEESAQSASSSDGSRGNEIDEELRALVTDALGKGLSPSSLLSAIRRSVAEVLAASGQRGKLVFLSYAHADKDVVRRVAQGLEAAGIDIWIDESEIRFGDSIAHTIQRGMDSADYVAFFLSNASINSPWAQRELNVAISRQLSADRGAVILPILLEDVEIPALLRDVAYLDLRSGEIEVAVKQLVQAIQRHSLERLHTYTPSGNQYFNPPEKVPTIGRKLEGKDFAHLVGQLFGDELLLGLYRNQVPTLVATHLHSKRRKEEMESLWGPSEGYYAVRRDDAEQGFQYGVWLG